MRIDPEEFDALGMASVLVEAEKAAWSLITADGVLPLDREISTHSLMIPREPILVFIPPNTVQQVKAGRGIPLEATHWRRMPDGPDGPGELEEADD